MIVRDAKEQCSDRVIATLSVFVVTAKPNTLRLSNSERHSNIVVSFFNV